MSCGIVRVHDFVKTHMPLASRGRVVSTIAAVLLSSLAAVDPAAADESRTAGEPYAPVPGGEFRSILPTGTKSTRVQIAPFALQRTPVTNGEFLAFVRAHPEWRRGRVDNSLADSRYLHRWRQPLDPGPSAAVDRPVTDVSWFAARAFCEAHKARLPTWYEWELTSAADERTTDARLDPAWRQKILTWYSQPSTRALPAVGRNPPNFYGIHDLHDLVWEWVEDFNAVFISGDNRNQGDPDRLRFCGSGALSVEDRENYPVMMRLAMLSSLKANSTTVNVGFRCAADAASGYPLRIPLETQDGRHIDFLQTRGRVRIVTMFYATCPLACPLTIDTLQAIERQLTDQERANLDVLMITLDPQSDTRGSLQHVVTERRLDTTRWSLARTAPADVRKLSAMLDIPYRRLDDGNFNHASVLVLMDGRGRSLARSSRMGQPEPEFVVAVRKALEDTPAPGVLPAKTSLALKGAKNLPTRVSGWTS
jgi:formylglycine-generating enzyme required for sulfatase activity